MGYYDTQLANQTPSGVPYSVQDMLLSTNAITNGVDKLVANSASDRKAEQQLQANQYVSKLLGDTNSDNYMQNSAQARSLLQYASPEMAQQFQQYGTDLNNQRNYENQKIMTGYKGQEVGIQDAAQKDTANYHSGELENDSTKIKNQNDQFGKSMDWAKQEFNNLSAAQKATLGIESQKLGISAQELLLKRKMVEIAGDKSSKDDKPNIFAKTDKVNIYDKYGRVIGQKLVRSVYNKDEGRWEDDGTQTQGLPSPTDWISGIVNPLGN